MYSFGLMLWELIHTRVVWQHLNGRQALMQVVADPTAMQPPFEQQGPPRPPPAECDILSSANSTPTSEFTTKIGNGVPMIPFNEEGSAMSEEGNPWPKLGGLASREYPGYTPTTGRLRTCPLACRPRYHRNRSP